MAVMIKALVFRHKMKTAVLVLPVATMISFAQLRGSMPDAPARFGAFALLSFFPLTAYIFRKGTNIG